MPHANAARNPDLYIADQIPDLEARLERALHEVAIWQSQAEVSSRCHHEDIAKIGEMLNAEATRRDWCNEYRAFVERVNQYLHTPLPLPPTEWRVTITYEVTAEFVVRCSDDDIEQQASDLYSKHQEPKFSFSVAGADIELADSSYDWEQM